MTNYFTIPSSKKLLCCNPPQRMTMLQKKQQFIYITIENTD